MIYSMTGYATKTLQVENTSIQLEIKSVNHRFLDISLKSAEEFKSLETPLRNLISQHISRGKVDIRIFFKDNKELNTQLHLNLNLLEQYLKLTQQIQELSPNSAAPSSSAILAVPGMIAGQNLDLEELQPAILNSFNELISAFISSQASEGAKLGKTFELKLRDIENIVEEVRPLLNANIANYQQKLRQRLQDFLRETELNETRLQQEVAFFCQKMDVNEEIERLAAHVEEFRALVLKGGQIGKRLDFICQEMHREANTFGSKSVSIETTRKAVDLKVLVEQIREQVQNIM